MKNIPIGWMNVEFQDIVESLKRGPFGSAIKKSFFVPKGYKVYEQRNAIYDDSSIGSYFISEEKYKELEAFRVLPKDFIVSCSGTIGKISQIPIDATPGVINQALLRIRILDDLVVSSFFLFLFRSRFFQKKILVETRGSAMLNIAGVKDLKTIKVDLPPLLEQHRIVAKIEELFSDLDAGIENLKKAREQLKIFRQAVLKFAFEGKLTQEWRKQNAHTLEPAEQLLKKIKNEREKQYNTQLEEWQKKVKEWENGGKKGKKPAKPKPPKELPPLTEDQLKELPELPKGWSWVQLNSISDKITDGEHSTPIRTKNGYYLLSARNVQNSNLKFDQVDYIPEDEYLRIIQRCNPEEGDILISCSGSVGRICAVPKNIKFTMVRSVALVKIQSNKYLSKYLEYQLQSPTLQKIINDKKKATAQANLFLEPISKLPIAMCSKKEISQIVLEIESRLSVCDKLEQTINESLKKAESLRQSILKKAFEGKLVPQDPSDLPAQFLLERIKKEKEQRAMEIKENQKNKRNYFKKKKDKP